MSATASIADDCEAPDPARRIAVAAHEIRTPLGGILALADLLLAEELSEAARGHAAALKTSAEHLLSVASALLGADMAPRRPEEIGLDAFLARVAPAIEARARAKGLAFTAGRAPETPERVIVNEAALRQIVENLADNALRATTAGTVALALERVACDGAGVTLRVVMRDTGPGLGPTPERLFQPFVQGETARGAAGLGLALVAAIARG
ncbi:sensor histidine kinase, partial [Methylopila musalis]